MAFFKKISFLFILFFGFTFLINAESQYQVIVNSENWEDVFSASNFANLKNYDFNYLSLNSDKDTFVKILDKRKRIILVESSKSSIIPGFETFLESKGFDIDSIVLGDVNEINLNLFAKGGFSKVLFVDDRSSYNLLSSITYGKIKSSYIVFFNKNLINNYEFNSKVEGIYIGNSFVSEGLNKYLQVSSIDERIIFKDKYKLNQQIISKILDIKFIDTVILTSGNVLEMDILIGNYPVLFIGKNQVPSSVIDFILNKDLKKSILIGVNDLQNGKFVREKTGIDVLVKMSKATVSGSPSQDKALQRESLDIFTIEPKESKLNVVDIIYNKATKEFILQIENLGETEAYFKTGLFVKNFDGEILETVSAKDILTLLPGESISQKISFNFKDSLDSVMILGQIFYGESEVSIDKEVKLETELEFVSILDSSLVEISSVSYNEETKRFIVNVKNIGEKRVYVSVKLKDVLIDDESLDFISETLGVEVGEEKEFKIKVFMDAVAIADNEEMNVKLNFGEKEDVLIKEDLKSFSYDIVSNNSNLFFVVVIIVLVIIIVVFMLFTLSKR